LRILCNIAGNQLLAGTFGITAATVLLDLGAGFARDHPPLARRLAGILVGPLGLLSLVLLAKCTPLLELLVLVGGFTCMALVYSYSWLRRFRAARRRPIGAATGVIGGLSLLFFMLVAGPADWSGGIVMGAYVASAALLGGFTTILIAFLTAKAPDEVPIAATPYGIPARFAAGGLAITVLAGLEMAIAVIGNADASWLAPVAFWLGLSLVVPAILTAAGHKLFPRFQPLIWGGALLSALAGQAAAHALLTFYPPLLPPGL